MKEWLKSVLNYRSYPKNKTGGPFFLDHPVQWHRGGTERQLPTPKFWAVGKMLENVLVQKFLSKNAAFWGNLLTVLKFWALNFLCRKFAAVCRNFCHKFTVSIGKLHVTAGDIFRMWRQWCKCSHIWSITLHCCVLCMYWFLLVLVFTDRRYEWAFIDYWWPVSLQHDVV